MQPESTHHKRDYYVVKSNDLIQKTRYSMPLSMQKAFAYICSLIRPPDNIYRYSSIDLTPHLTYSFDIKDYCRVCGISWNAGGSAIAYVKHSLKSLADESIYMDIGNGKEELCRWLDKVIIDKSSNMVTVTIGRQLSPYLFSLKKRFTSYELWNILNMKSAYSIRLFELLKSYSNMEQVSFTVDELKKLLFVQGNNCRKCKSRHTKKCLECDEYKNIYRSFKQFNSKVLQNSLNEINLYSSMTVKMSTVKRGRSVESIIFMIKKSPYSYLGYDRRYGNSLLDEKERTNRYAENNKNGTSEQSPEMYKG